MAHDLIEKITRIFLVATILLGPSTAFALASAGDFEQCRQFFVDETPPLVSQPENLHPRALCFSAFAVFYSGASRTPIYVAERLNRNILLEARHNQRTNKFYSDARLPRAERAELDDYHGSGYDRGHMAPAGDMGTREAMAQSFSLANMVPQAPVNNRKLWSNIEKATRKYIMRARGDVYVITGPVFENAPRTIGANRIWVPQHLFKLVYDPGANRAWAYWVENTDEARADKPISYDELVQRTGIKFFPGLK